MRHSSPGLALRSRSARAGISFGCVFFVRFVQLAGLSFPGWPAWKERNDSPVTAQQLGNTVPARRASDPSGSAHFGGLAAARADSFSAAAFAAAAAVAARSAAALSAAALSTAGLIVGVSVS